jgi:hypothetical protein
MHSDHIFIINIGDLCHIFNWLTFWFASVTSLFFLLLADGLTDCGDSSCCSHPACSENIMCVYFADPLDVLHNRPQAVKIEADIPPSFFHQVRFLIEGDKPVQSYAKPEFYDQRRASVIRGRVTTAAGEGIIGVRVSVDRTRGASNYGFTLTRPGGWFDMLVNGGGGVTLQFQRSPFRPLTRTVRVPWNRIQIIEPIVMAAAGGGGGNIAREEEEDSVAAVANAIRYSAPCLAHHTKLPSPIILESSGPQPGESKAGSATATDSRTILPERGLLLETVPVPDTSLRLTYISSAAAGQLSILRVRLTPPGAEPEPGGLLRIHLRIEVAGQVERSVLEPEPDLVYTFGWNKVGGCFYFSL